MLRKIVRRERTKVRQLPEASVAADREKCCDLKRATCSVEKRDYRAGRSVFISKRFIDIFASGALLIILAIPMALIAVAVKLTSQGSVLYWSARIGRNNRVFRMPKFRSMRTDAPELATHLLRDPGAYLTPIGSFLRRSSLDELPQLFSVVRGDLSLVGPRPALFNQDDLIALRTEFGVHHLIPGITGWAQVNGRDELAIPEKVRLDVEYLRDRSLRLDAKILVMTALKVVRREGVAH